MSLQDITITASINSIVTQSYGQRTYIASTDEQSFPIEEITGSHAGTWPNFISNTDYTTNLVVNITQSWSESIVTPLGIVNTIHNTMEEFIDGEFSGSNCTVSNGDLTDSDCQQFLVANNKSFKYSIFPYASQSYYPFFHPNTIPRDGEILIYYIDSPYPTESVQYAKISTIDKDGIDLTNTLSQLTVGNYIEWIDSGSGLVKLEVEYRTSFANYFLFKFKPNLIITPGYFDDNYLDYKFIATSSFSNFTASVTGSTYYLTYGVGAWNITTDNANGWNPISEQYFFPLSPNTTIYTTASISMSINAPVTFSWGLQAWQINSNPNQIIDGIPSTVPIYNNANKLYLNAGQHNLIISSSIYQPIQNYAHEIDFYTETQHYIDNPYLIGTGSYFNSNIPEWFKAWSGSGNTNTFTNTPTLSNNWRSYELQNSPINQGGYIYPGGVYLQDPNIDNTLLTYWGPTATVNLWNAGDDGKLFDILVEIPNIKVNDDFYGPSSKNLQVVTCVQGASTITTSSLIGIIPSGASGVFNFQYVVTSSVDKKIGIYAPSGSTKDNGSYLEYALISRIEVSPRTTASVHTVRWSMSQSNVPQNSTSSFLFEPYYPGNFNNTDCDVLMNNYSQNDINGLYRDVLYDDGGTIPSNLQQIISGTAQYAEVSDYLYKASANRLPRYDGTRVIQQQENKWTPGDVGFSQTPSVTVEQTYFAYFDYLQDTSYELTGKSAAHIIYLIDKDGNIQTPTLTGSYYYNLIDNFETDKNVSLTITTLNGDKIFLGNKKIIRPGVFPRAVLYSQLKDDPTVISPLVFGNQQFGYVPTYNSIYKCSQFNVDATSTPGGITVPMNLATTYDPSNEIYLDATNDRIKILSDSNVTKLTFTVNIYNYVTTQYPNSISVRDTYVTLYLQKSTDGINWNIVDQANGFYMGNRNTGPFNQFGTQPISALNYNSYTFDFQDNPIEDIWYRVMIYSGNGYEYFTITNNSNLEIAQTVAGTDTSTMTYDPGNDLYYWTTGSSSPNVLTSSQFFSVYNPGFPLTQAPTPFSGYADCIPFLINPNITQIRFEGDENQVYTITNVEYNVNSASFNDLNNYVPNGGSNWLIGGGSASVSPLPGTVTANNYIERSINGTLVPGKAYTILFSIKESVSGSLYFDFNNGYSSNTSSLYTIQNIPFGSGVGTSINVIAPSNIPGGNYLRIRGNDSASITLDYASIFFDNDLYLTLDRPTIPGTDINSFLIREFQPNPNYVIIDNPPISSSYDALGINYDGYLMAEYTTNDLRQNFDNIIVSLKERSLI